MRYMYICPHHVHMKQTNFFTSCGQKGLTVPARGCEVYGHLLNNPVLYKQDFL